MELINNGSYEFFKVDSEEWRCYEYIEIKDGEQVSMTITIEEPLYVSVNKVNGGHRILDASGVSHYIQPGWKHLAWKAKPGQPHFVK